MAEDKLRKMRELVDTLNEAADAYYNGHAFALSVIVCICSPIEQINHLAHFS